MSESVKTKTNLVRTAAKGEQVRTSIADAIDEIDDHVDEVFETEFVAVDPTLSVSGNGADAKVTGNRISSIEATIFPTITDAGFLISDFVEDEKWSATDKISKDTTMRRSKNLYPILPFKILHIPEAETNGQIRVNFFDHDGNGITSNGVSTWYIFRTADYTIPCIAPPGAVSFGVSVKKTWDGSMTCMIIGGETDNIDAQYEGDLKSYHVMPKRCNTSSGSLMGTNDYDLVILPISDAESLYCSYNVGNCVVATDSQNVKTVLTGERVPRLDGSEYEVQSRKYVIPAGTKVLSINFPRIDGTTKHQIGTDGENISYVNIKRTSGSGRLYKKKILCIGDSITWLDQRAISVESAGVVGPITGYQKQLRYAGADVTTLGGNGYLYSVMGSYGSLYTSVVTNNIDVTPYDIIILAAGSNDIGRRAPIGALPEKTSEYNEDPETFCGAVTEIIKYIKQHNQSAEIYVVAQHQYNASDRNYEKALPYRQALLKCAEFWGVPCIDLFTLSGISIGTFNYYLYDGVHPNTRGMKRFGEIITSKVVNRGDNILAESVDNLTIEIGKTWEV